MPRSLLDEFRVETEELLDGVATALLALEQDDSGDQVALLLRHLHTIKGSSGIFPIGPFTAAVHAAEGVLGEVRAGALSVCPEMVDDLLATTDRLRSWLGAIGPAGDLEVDTVEAKALLHRLHRWTGRPGPGDGRVERTSPADARAWLAVLPEGELRRCREWLERTGARVRLIRYQPAPEAFSQGEDPVALLRSVPALDVVGVALSTPLGEEGFDCALTFVAISRAEPAEVATTLAAATGAVAVAEVGAADLVPGHADDPAGIAVSLLRAQIASLDHPAPEAQQSARLRSAAAAAGAALRVLLAGPDTPVRLAHALEVALSEHDARHLIAHLRGELEAAGAGVGGGGGGEDPDIRTPLDRAADSAKDDAFPSTAEHHLRIDRATVDRLLRYTAELVVAANALPYIARRAEEDGRRELARELHAQATTTRRVVDEVEALVLAMRMVPVAAAFDRFPRLVRDAARRSGKRIRLVLEGGDIHADADVVDVLGKALVHLVRNAVGHGIELPAVRRAGGKAEEGAIVLRAREDAGGLVVEVTDDGAGMDVGGLVRGAVAAGLVSQDEASHLGPQRAAELAFLPGLSTASRVSDLSGRGVGLDAVQTVVRSAHGVVTVKSQPERGTTVQLRLPRSLTITDALVVRSGGQSFAVPIDQVRETARVPAADRHRLGRAEVVQLHGAPVPLRSLDTLLRLHAPPAANGGEGAGSLVLVVDTDGGPVALAVDGIEGREEVLIKPLDDLLAGQLGVLGTSLRPDGSVLIVLQAGELTRAS